MKKYYKICVFFFIILKFEKELSSNKYILMFRNIITFLRISKKNYRENYYFIEEINKELKKNINFIKDIEKEFENKKIDEENYLKFKDIINKFCFLYFAKDYFLEKIGINPNFTSKLGYEFNILNEYKNNYMSFYFNLNKDERYLINYSDINCSKEKLKELNASSSFFQFFKACRKDENIIKYSFDFNKRIFREGYFIYEIGQREKVYTFLGVRKSKLKDCLDPILGKNKNAYTAFHFTRDFEIRGSSSLYKDHERMEEYKKSIRPAEEEFYYYWDGIDVLLKKYANDLKIEKEESDNKKERRNIANSIFEGILNNKNEKNENK
jgi:hypothetical protein